MDYQHLLSQKTLEKKNNKQKKSTCPKCGKSFLRLDTHIQKSATCRNAPTHSTPPTSTEQPHVYNQTQGDTPGNTRSSSPPPSFVSHSLSVPRHPDITSCFSSHPCNVPPSFVTSPPHKHTPCPMSFVTSTHAPGTHPSHTHTYPTNLSQLSLTHISQSTPIITSTPPQSHYPTGAVPSPPPHPTTSNVPPPPPHPTTSAVPTPPPHPTASVVPPPPPHPTASVVSPLPHPTASVVPPPPHPSASVVPPPPHPSASVVPPPPHPTASVVPPPPHPTASVVPPPPHPTTSVVPPPPHPTASAVHFVPKLRLPTAPDES